MANVRISDLPVATLPLTGAELIEITQGGVSRQAIVGDMAPVDTTYLVLSASGILTQERVFTPDATMLAVDGGAGLAYTLGVKPSFFSGLAAPTAQVGLAAIPGVATTGMRSDGAPALNQGIAPSWTGQHTFTLATLFADGTLALPGVAYAADTNTGLFRSGADTLQAVAGGVASFQATATAASLLLQALAINGLVGAPAYSFTTDPNTGVYSVGADDIGVSTGGTLRWDVSTTAITSTLQRLGQAGAVGTPAYSFSGDPNTGIYSVGADDLGISTGGTLRFDVSTTVVTSTLPFLGPNGAVGNPTFSFSGDPNTGIYDIGADDLGVSTGGVLRLEINSTGAVSVKQPTSGIPLTVNGPNAGTNSNLVVQDTAASCQLYLQNDITGLTNYIGSSGAASRAFGIKIGNTVAFAINTAGAVSIPAPTAGNALDVTALANQYAVKLHGGVTASQSFGLQILAGTNTADFALAITSGSAVTDYFRIRGDGQAQVIDGTAAIPALSFISDVDTGIYHAAANYMAFSAGGVFQGGISTNGLNMVDGAVATPSITFDADPNTGIYRIGADNLGLTAGGTLAASIDPGHFRVQDGLIGSPGFCWNADTSTGLFRSGAGVVAFAASGGNVGEYSTRGLGVANGSAGTPALYFQNSNTTGLFRQAANVIGVAINGAQAVCVNGVTTTGAQTATFVSANKPGAGAAAPIAWLPVLTAGGTQGYIPIFGA